MLSTHWYLCPEYVKPLLLIFFHVWLRCYGDNIIIIQCTTTGPNFLYNTQAFYTYHCHKFITDQWNMLLCGYAVYTNSTNAYTQLFDEVVTYVQAERQFWSRLLSSRNSSTDAFTIGGGWYGPVVWEIIENRHAYKSSIESFYIYSRYLDGGEKR